MDEKNEMRDGLHVEKYMEGLCEYNGVRVSLNLCGIYLTSTLIFSQFSIMLVICELHCVFENVSFT